MPFGGGNDDIEIQVTIDENGAVKVFDALGKEMDTVAKKAERSESSFSKLQANLISVNQAADLVTKVFRGVANTVDQVLDALDEAGKIEGLERSFENLQASVGKLADVTLQKMRTATKGLVSDMELMQQTNQAVLLGLPTEQIDKLSAAALKLGAATGITATQALQSLVTGLGRASPLILDNLGITVKAAEAQQFYANKLKTTVDALTETQKAEAFREFAISKIIAKEKELADVQETASVAYTRVQTTITNLTGELFKQISANENLREAFVELDKVLRDLDFEAFGTAIAEGTALVIEMTANVIDLINTLTPFGKVLFNLGRLAFNLAQHDLKEAKDAFENLGHATNEALEQIGLGTKKTEEASKSLKKLAKGLDKAGDSAGDSGKEYKKLNIEQQILQDQMKGPLLVALKQIEEEFRRGERAIDDIIPELEEMRELFELMGYPIEEADNAIKGLSATLGTLEKESPKDFIDALSESLFGLADASGKTNDIGVGIGEAVGAGIADGISTAIDGIFNGDDNLGEQIFSSIGGSGGAAIGQAYGGPAGAAIGGALGENLGKLFGESLDKAFGGSTNKGTLSRRAIEGFIDDLIKEANFQITNAEGKIVPFTDLILGDRNKFGAGEPFDELIRAAADVAPQLVNAFQAFGGGFAELVGGEFVNGLQVGSALLDSFVGDIDDLANLVDLTGYKFEDFETAFVAAFKRGEIGALELESKLRDLAPAFEPGLVGIGAIDQAFSNLIESTGRGQIAITSLRDLSIESQEKGAKSLEDLRKELLATGDYSASQIEKLFSALSLRGITSLDELKDASDRVLIGVLSDLEATGFEFAESLETASRKIESLTQLVENFPDKEVDLKIKVKASFENNDAKKAFDQVGQGIPTG